MDQVSYHFKDSIWQCLLPVSRFEVSSLEFEKPLGSWQILKSALMRTYAFFFFLACRMDYVNIWNVLFSEPISQWGLSVGCSITEAVASDGFSSSQIPLSEQFCLFLACLDSLPCLALGLHPGREVDICVLACLILLSSLALGLCLGKEVDTLFECICPLKLLGKEIYKNREPSHLSH